MKLSKLQQQIIDMPYNKIVVNAAAAAGKTQLMTEKVRQLLRAGVNPREIAVITFTNMAAGTLRQRLGEDYKDGLFIGTIHSLANYMLCTANIDTSFVLSQDRFDDLFVLVRDNPRCIRHYEWILLDEAQDSDKLQFEFLFKMIDPPYFFVVGDPRQSIYGFKGSDPQLMMNLAAHPDVQLVSLNENYRNSSNILSFARYILEVIGLEDDSIPMRGISGKVTQSRISLDTVISNLRNVPKPGDWAILCRTNNEVFKVITKLKNNNIPFDTFKQSDLTNEELATRMDNNTIKVLTIHSAKGLEWNNVVVVGARFFPSEERHVCYVAATRARNQLIWLKSFKN